MDNAVAMKSYKPEVLFDEGVSLRPELAELAPRGGRRRDRTHMRTAKLVEIGAAEKTMPTIPKDAVQTIGNQQYVFVASEKSNEFILRPVRIGVESMVFIRSLKD